VIGTDEFESLARLESKARGMADLNVAITRHPIGGLKPAEVAAKAESMTDVVRSAVAVAAAARVPA